MFKLFLMLGSINAFVCIALGAFGAHGLKNKIHPDLLAAYQTGVQYHMMHALALLVIAALSDKLGSSTQFMWSGRLLFVGIILFSGSLYIMAVTGIKWLGAITPLGGIAFLAGWALLAVAAFKSAS